MKINMRLWVPLAVVFGVILYVVLYISGEHSDGYKFLDQTIRKSPVIQQRVGDVRTVRLSFLGGYHERYVGSKKWLTMTLNVTGSKGVVTVKAAAKAEDDTWSLSDASIDGERISLN